MGVKLKALPFKLEIPTTTLRCRDLACFRAEIIDLEPQFASLWVVLQDVSHAAIHPVVLLPKLNGSKSLISSGHGMPPG